MTEQISLEQLKNEEHEDNYLHARVNDEYVSISKLQGILGLDEFSLDYGVQVGPFEMLTLAQVMGCYNEYSPKLATALVKGINALIPRMSFYPGNPNNGRTFHHFKVGREGSRVLYLEVTKTYLPSNYDYASLTKALNRLAEKAKYDEFWVTEETPTSYVYRMWWD